MGKINLTTEEINDLLEKIDDSKPTEFVVVDDVLSIVLQ